MGDVSSDKLPPATLRERWAVLTMPALLVVGVSVCSGQLLCAVIELPIYAPQRESPAIAVTIITAWWLTVASLAAVFTWIGANAAGLAGRLRRRWRLFTLGLVLATWAVIVVMYATHPWTAGRWAKYWPIYYG